MLTINGAVLEGGGQILRNSVSLSALLSKPIRIESIRNNRKPPGLKNQHATGIRLAAEICSAKITGVENGSTIMTFKPGKDIIPGNYSADPVTAGSATLLLQISIPCLLFSQKPFPSTLSIKGGTNASNAPQIDYTQNILFPFLRRHFGLDGLKIEVERRGYFPKGGGLVKCSIMPTSKPIPAVTLLTRGEITVVRGVAHIAGLPSFLGQEMADAAIRTLVAGGIDKSVIKINVTREKNENTVGGGSGIVLWAETSKECLLGGSAVGNKKLKPEDVGQDAANELLKAIKEGGCVDEYLQDQIIIFMALADGRSSILTGPLSLHTETAIWVAEQITNAKFEVEKLENSQCIIHCQGIGYTYPFQQKEDHEEDFLVENTNRELNK